MNIYVINYEGKKKMFRYNRERAEVSYVAKATAEEIADNQKWLENMASRYLKSRATDTW